MASETDLIVVIGGETITSWARVGRVQIRDVLNDAPNTALLTIDGSRPTRFQSGAFVVGAFDAGAFQIDPVVVARPPLQVGHPIQMYLGMVAPERLVFGGELTRIQQDYDLHPDHVTFHLSCVDYTRALNRRKLLKRYPAQSATLTVLDILATAAPAITGAHVAADLPVIDAIAFTFEDVSRALSRVAEKIGGAWYVDYAGDLHFFQTESADPPEALTATARFADLTFEYDLTQVRTRVLVEGLGSALRTGIAAGESLIPVDDAIAFNPAGGLLVIGQHRAPYTGRVLGGAGTIVGPGARPAAAPAATIQVGSGVTTGLHGYAVTFATASGESLPGPGRTVEAGLLSSPSSAVNLVPVSGSGLSPGLYRYAVTFVTAGGETVPGPEAVTSVAVVAPPATAPAAREFEHDTGALDKNANYRYAVTFTTVAWPNHHQGETTPGPQSNIARTSTGYMLVDSLPIAADPAITGLVLYRTMGNGTLLNEATFLDLDRAYYSDDNSDGSLGIDPPTVNTAMGSYGQVDITGIPIGPSGTTARKIYRTAANGSTLRLVATIANNTATTVRDSVPDGSLGAVAPSTTTAIGNQIALSQIPIGPSGTTARKIYRTAANQSALQLLTTLADNTTATWLDTAADATLGASPPAIDTSGLKQPEGEVPPGAATIPVAGTSMFAPTGGWAVIGNGQQTIRYTGLSGTALTGIPAVGPGAITATVVFNSTITAAATLTGLPAAGAGAIPYAMPAGVDVHLVAQSDDVSAQAAIAAIEGGDGIIEHYIQDRRLSETSAFARGRAELELFKTFETRVRYTTRDVKTRSGKTVRIDLPPPTNLFGDFLIQSVTLTQFQIAPNLAPQRQVEASSTRFTFDDVLRRMLMEAH